MTEKQYIAYLKKLKRHTDNGCPLKDFVDYGVDDFARELIEYTLDLYKENQRLTKEASNEIRINQDL